MSNRTIGWIGLGLVGTAATRRLIAAGYTLIGTDISALARSRLVEQGGTALDTAQHVAEQCERVVLSLPDSTIARQVIDQIEEFLPAGAIVIDTTTGDPRDAVEFAAQLAQSKVAYLDATITGSSRQIADGEAVITVGGDRAAYETCRQALGAIAARVAHVGPAGHGAKLKLATNLVLGLNRAALAEGLNFARKLGLDPNLCLDLWRDSAAYSRAMDSKGPKMIAGDYSPQARLAQHRKDVRLILQAAAQARAKTPLSQLHEQLLGQAEKLGCGDLDNSAIARVFE